MNLYEAKYSKYLIYNSNRFAEESEILEGLTPIERGAGIPLYFKNGEIYVDDNDTNTITIGPTGCGKTRAINKILLFSIINMMDSVLVNDPKGELYVATSSLAKEKGYNVKVLNLRHPEISDRWNPLGMIYKFYKNGEESKANQAIDEFATALMNKTANNDDRYWDIEAAGFLSALIKLFLRIVPEQKYFTLQNILPFAERDAETHLKRIIGYFGNLPESIVSPLKSVIGLEAEKTKTCIYSVVSAGINHLVKNESLLNVFSGTDIDLEEVGRTPTAIYIIYPDEQIALDNVVNSFLTQSYVALNWVCSEYDNNRLPICVHFDLEEFSNLCAIEKFDNRISECRSKNIRFHLFIQGMNQLSEKYSEPIANTILSNCSSWVCFSSREIKFLDTISQICGKVVDWKGNSKPLISSSDMQYLKKHSDDVEVLILRQGIHPYVVSLPYYDKSSVYSPKLNYHKKKTSKCKKETEKDDYYFTTEEWSDLVYEAYLNARIRNNERSTEESEELDDIQAQLERKFDELFGSVDD